MQAPKIPDNLILTSKQAKKKIYKKVARFCPNIYSGNYPPPPLPSRTPLIIVP